MVMIGNDLLADHGGGRGAAPLGPATTGLYPREEFPAVSSTNVLRSSKALTDFLPAHERDHALVQLATPEERLPRREAIERCVAGNDKLERHPWARCGETLTISVRPGITSC